ncbi:MAG: phage terminase large subunit [Ginsengibacter sp.]
MDKIIKYTSVFAANKKAYDSKKYRVIANEGSSGSSKTHSLCQLMPVIALTEKKSISIVSPSLPHLKRGARRNFLDILNEWGIYDDNDFNKTDQVYHFPRTGSYIEFFGTDDAGRVRGPRRDILYFNELNLSTFDIYTQLSIRTNDVIFFDLNPADEYSFCYTIADEAGNKKIHSTYRNNLGNLTKENIKAIEDLQNADENLWRVFGLGLRGTSSETIYTHWQLCDELPNRGEQWYGLDFGYNVETALVKVELFEGAIYAEELIYETKLTTTDLIEKIKSLKIDKWKEIYCDAAEPKAIMEIKQAGYNAMAADKDVSEGIKKVKSYPLYITRTSTDLIKEIKSYKYIKKSDGTVSDEPVKFRDHGADATRYAVFSKLSKPKRIVLI